MNCYCGKKWYMRRISKDSGDVVMVWCEEHAPKTTDAFEGWNWNPWTKLCLGWH